MQFLNFVEMPLVENVNTLNCQKSRLQGLMKLRLGMYIGRPTVTMDGCNLVRMPGCP